MLDRVNLKLTAKSQLKGKWGSGSLITFIYMILTIGLGLLPRIPITGGFWGLGSLFLSPPIALGMVITFIIFVKNNELKTENLFKGFEINGLNPA
jgi:uncharacterized membrane protein